MDYLFLFSIIGGVAFVFLFVAAKIAIRWTIRLILLGVLFLFVVGGATWWLSKPAKPLDHKTRPAAARATPRDQR